MKHLFVVMMVLAFAGPAFAQSKPVPRYGETDKPKTPSEIESDRAADAAYRRSLGNVPNAGGATDPWGTIRSDPAKPAAKSAQPKSAK